jgi:enolase
MILKNVSARTIKDSRGEITIEVSVNNGPWASSPSGKSTGAFETKPYNTSLEFCIRFLNEFREPIVLWEFEDLERVEIAVRKKLGLKEAREFGGNALFAFESAILKALALEQGKEVWQLLTSRPGFFPRPVGNIVGGGMHSTRLGQHPLFQEFLLIPREQMFAQNVEIMQRIYVAVGRALNAKKVNDEGAWHAPLEDEGVLKILSEYRSMTDIGIDMAASSFFKSNLYDYQNTERTPPAHIEHLTQLIKTYEVFYVEDPVEQNDFAGFAKIKKESREAIVVGDDLTATHLDRVEKAIKQRSIGALIVKPNQNGSLLEVKQIMDYCKKHKIQTIFSHRSGETMDNVLADYAFGFHADFIKCGVATKWRETKLNRLVEIEKSLK